LKNLPVTVSTPITAIHRAARSDSGRLLVGEEMARCLACGFRVPLGKQVSARLAERLSRAQAVNASLPSRCPNIPCDLFGFNRIACSLNAPQASFEQHSAQHFEQQFRAVAAAGSSRIALRFEQN
jgi:hypothetical protein